ncbi:homocysteine S-methyltransferase family protein [Flavisolibacter sp. BT320]|nr:homocysteine S-methyltransferase family protein [Flavisolibacter longurius]
MARSTALLPTTSNDLYLTDGGLETTLVFLQGFDLPCFAAFDLLKDEKGYAALQDYYRGYLQIAKEAKTNFILESPTWRANPDWMEKIGYKKEELAAVNEKAIQLLKDLKQEFENDIPQILISGCIGPRGDGYKPGATMTSEEAQAYHSEQVGVFRKAQVDLVSAITMNYAEEAIGICLAAGEAGIPVVISFTVETNGLLPDGKSLQEAIRLVDENTTNPPIYYMINCAHPSHFKEQLENGRNEDWTNRIKGLRANASCKSHAELDESTELDTGNPQELGAFHRQLKDAFPHINVFGGCCGTDEEHVRAIASEVKTAVH